MKRSLSFILILGLIAGAIAIAPTAEAKKKKKKPKVATKVERKVEFDYTMGGIGVASPAGSAGACPMTEPGSGQCIEFPPQTGEGYIKVEVADASGTSMAGFISQGDVDGDGVSDGYGEFCGAHPEAIPLADPAALVRVSFYPGVCADGSPSFPTMGTITVTFSNMP